MPTPNHVQAASRYRRQERWRDSQAGWLIWPALWCRRGIVRGLFIEETTWTVGWGYWRWQWTCGLDQTPDLSHPASWQQVEGPAFLEWAQKTFGGDWPRERAQEFFRIHGRWRDLVTQGHLDNHYLRILMAREMWAMDQSSRPGAEGADALDRL